jgi:hypothetical protein
MPILRIFILTVSISTGSVSWLLAAEPSARDLISPETALLVEINRPLDLIDNPLTRDVWELLGETNGVRQALSSQEFEKFRQVGKFIEKSLGVDWQTGIGRLTEGGIVVAIGKKTEQTEPPVTAIVTAADEKTLNQFIDAVRAEIRRAANRAEAEPTRYRSYTCQRVGNGQFSVVGRQLLVSNSRAGLEAALDRLAGVAPNKAFDPPASLRLVDSSGNAPVILATGNLKMLREDPKIQAALTLPAGDPAPVVLLGGYFDLLRRADFAAAGLFVNGPAHELKIRCPVGSDGAYAGLRGYFASESTESAPPLLRPHGTVFSAAWFRDYKKMWDSRRELLSTTLVQKLEADNAKAQSEGPKIGLADLVQFLGPHFRFVAARRQEAIYKINLEERLPSFALVVSVRDEPTFRQRVLQPVESLLWLGVTSANLGEIKTAEHRGAKVSTVRFSEKADVTDPQQLALYNFDPSYALSRGNLIVGSNSEIVRNLIDELEKQPSETVAARAERATDRQQLSLAELSELLRDFDSRLVQGAVVNRGLARADAEKEIGVLHQVLKRLGNLTVESVVADDHFDCSVRLGSAEEQ